MQLLPIRLRPGDRPTDLGMTPDRQTLISLNTGSASASFLDPATTLETSRVQTGYEPSYLLIDRSGKRAYVCNRMSSSITVLDVANRATVGLIATEASPVAVQLNRDGTKLFVVHSGSPFLTVYAVPSYTLLGRYFIGLGAASLNSTPSRTSCTSARPDPTTSTSTSPRPCCSWARLRCRVASPTRPSTTWRTRSSCSYQSAPGRGCRPRKPEGARDARLRGRTVPGCTDRRAALSAR